jgi:outer membrane lipoprotein carrier protein
MRSVKVLFFLKSRLMISMFVSAAFCVSAYAGPARDQLNAFSKGVKTMQSSFSQSISDANGRKKDQNSGLVSLMAPRQFRWDIQKPYPQLIVADGNAIWVHDVELEQVNVRAQSFDESNSPLAVLLDLAMLDVEFKSVERKSAQGQQWLRLTAKAKNPDFKYADLGFAGNQLQTMRILDNFGQKTEITFSKWTRNANLPPSLFQFTPPKGVDVIGEAPASAVIQKIPE